MHTQLRYHGKPIAANTTVPLTGNALGGFLCIVGGTITVTYSNGNPLITAFPVTAGNFYPLPFILGHNGGSFTTAGGAVGVIGV